MNRNRQKQVENRAVFDGLPEFLAVSVALYAEIQERTGFGIQDVPHLGFSGFAFHTPGILVIRVHLDRQRLLRIDELDQHREALHVPAVSSQNLPAFVFNILGQGLAGIVSCHDFTLSVLVCGQFPALGQGIHVGFFIVEFFQLGPTPDVVLERGVQFYNCHIQSTSFLSSL